MFGPKTHCVVVVGAQWGDEGKGKIVDVLAERADLVVRYQGGANAGHTVHTAAGELVSGAAGIRRTRGRGGTCAAPGTPGTPTAPAVGRRGTGGVGGARAGRIRVARGGAGRAARRGPWHIPVRHVLQYDGWRSGGRIGHRPHRD